MATMGYEKILQFQLQEILHTEKPIVLFGVMLMGKMAKRVLDYFQKDLVCFCDNHRERLEREEREFGAENLLDVPILDPEELKLQYPEALIVICTYSHQSYQEISKQLRDLNYSEIYNYHSLFYAYQTMILSRSADPDFSYRIAQTILLREQTQSQQSNQNMNETIMLETLGSLQTERCTLKCKNCGNWIPYVQKPRHFDANKFITGIRKICESVDGVHIFSISGGEALLHPCIVDICRETAKIGNILQITIITNGAWVPKEEVIKEISKYVSRILISDYGVVSSQKMKLRKLCQKYGLTCETKLERFTPWCDVGSYEDRHRSKEDNDELFRKCMFHDHVIVCEDKFYLCARGPFGVSGWDRFLPESDYVDLSKDDDRYSRKKEIIQLLHRKSAPASCSYCNGTCGKAVVPGEQI